MTWPFVKIDRFEVYGRDALAQANAEFVALRPRLYPETRDAFAEFTSRRYKEDIQESHMIAYGNLDKLNQNESLFVPFVSKRNEEGEFVPDDDRPDYFAAWSVSPPQFTYASINWNVASVPDAAMTINATKSHKETAFMIIRPYLNIKNVSCEIRQQKRIIFEEKNWLGEYLRLSLSS
jgi:hypothetical protein